MRDRELVFQPGSNRECFDLDITDDTVDEPLEEDLFLTITTTGDGVTLTPDTTRVIITDDDGTKTNSLANNPFSFFFFSEFRRGCDWV